MTPPGNDPPAPGRGSARAGDEDNAPAPARSPALRELFERGFVEQCSDWERLDAALLREPMTFYFGVDPTGPSMHVGHLVPVMAARILQRHGHRPILLVGGGTAMIGDPSGKIEMRKVLSVEAVAEHKRALGRQFSRFLQLEGDECATAGAAVMVDNADWLLDVRYVEFLRDIGRHFTVNRMIAAKTYRDRLESELPLSFLEFNYQLLQAYDFLRLHRERDCALQIGGSDQWGNMIAGVELIRRVRADQRDEDSAGHDDAFCLTFRLITTSDGKKMGKTERGAVWIDGDEVSPYEYYQYWINCDDRDVAKLLSLYSDVALDEILALTREGGAALRPAKARLAWEATALAHGRAAADAARTASEQAFGAGDDWSAVPCVEIAADSAGLVEVLTHPEIGVFKSRREARQRVEDGAIRIDGAQCKDTTTILHRDPELADGHKLQIGKKHRIRVRLTGG